MSLVVSVVNLTSEHLYRHIMKLGMLVQGTNTALSVYLVLYYTGP